MDNMGIRVDVIVSLGESVRSGVDIIINLADSFGIGVSCYNRFWQKNVYSFMIE